MALGSGVGAGGRGRSPSAASDADAGSAPVQVTRRLDAGISSAQPATGPAGCAVTDFPLMPHRNLSMRIPPGRAMPML